MGSPLLYGTPKEFLIHFGLNSLDDLPSIEDFNQFLEVLDARPEPPSPGSDESTPAQSPVVDAGSADHRPTTPPSPRSAGPSDV